MALVDPSNSMLPWQGNGATANKGLSSETIGSALRTLAARAEGNNFVVNEPLIGSRPWKVLVAAWPASTAVAVGDLYSNSGKVYQCMVAGTTAASGGPTSSNKEVTITDGTAKWILYLGGVGDQVSNGGNVYEIVTMGLPATTGGGPTGYGAAITDGTITWRYIGKQTAPVISYSPTVDPGLTKTYNPVDGLIDGNGVIRYEGGVPLRKYVGANYVGCVSIDSAPAAGNFTGTLTSLTNRFTTVIEDVKCEFSIAGGKPVFFFVNGRPIASHGYPFTVTGGSSSLVLDWTNAVGGRSTREVCLNTGLGQLLLSVNVSPTGSASFPHVPYNFSTVFIGDSMTASTGTSDNTYCWVLRFADRVGLPNACQVAIGGTGVLATNNGNSTNYNGLRLADLARIHAFRPIGVIFVQASTNDGAFTVEEIKDAAHRFLMRLRSAYPTVPIFVQGVFQANLDASHLPREQAWADVVTKFNNDYFDNLMFFVPVSTEPTGKWVFGTGRVGATTGDGNADFNISSDNVHPSDTGHNLWSKRYECAYKRIIETLA